MTVRPFIEAEQAEQRNVARACELLEVSRSAYYQWRKHVPSARELSDADLAKRITEIHGESKGTYGIPRGRHHPKARPPAPAPPRAPPPPPAPQTSRRPPHTQP